MIEGVISDHHLCTRLFLSNPDNDQQLYKMTCVYFGVKGTAFRKPCCLKALHADIFDRK